MAAIVVVLPCAPIAFAEEGGCGHYLPGSMASFIDGVPATETFLTRLNVVNYDGSIDGNVRVPIGGLTTLGADAKSWGYGLTILWRPPIRVLLQCRAELRPRLPAVEREFIVDVAEFVDVMPTVTGLGGYCVAPT
jgi:hypothetical protein